jgi:protein TonB
MRNCDGGLLQDGEAAAMLRKPPLTRVPEVFYSDDALAKKVGGIALVKCVVELDGSTSDCRIVKGLPYMNSAILQTASNLRFAGPVLFCDRPQRVEMIIPLRIPRPR